MHLALLMTNTDTSDFAQRHPKDDVKFADLIALAEPTWQVTSFSVKDGVFPDELSHFDGIMIGGSPASVHDNAPWIARLLELIREADAKGFPMFGACFGHQAIALALGGRVERNSEGWAFGRVSLEVVARPFWLTTPDRFDQYAAHIEQVTELPDGITPIFRAKHCEIAGFARDTTIYTTQNHPEMTPHFIAALVEELSDDLGPNATYKARYSLNTEVERLTFAQSITAFFRHAHDGSR